MRPAGVRSNLRRAGAGWELVTVSQLVYGFDGQGRLASIRNPRGVGVSLAYTATGITITDPSGRAVAVRITGGLIRDILLPDQRKVQYEYDSAGRLAVYKDAWGPPPLAARNHPPSTARSAKGVALLEGRGDSCPGNVP